MTDKQEKPEYYPYICEEKGFVAYRRSKDPVYYFNLEKVKNQAMRISNESPFPIAVIKTHMWLDIIADDFKYPFEVVTVYANGQEVG